jgi:hypothetical protein
MMRTLIVLILFGVVGESTTAGAVVVEIVAAFEGNRGPGWKAAANVHGAVGPKHIVDFTEGGFTVHDKATGKVLRHLSQREFWNKVEPPNSIDPQKDANDPWMLYDPLSERWFATVSGTSDPDSFLAVSTSSDPMQAWKGTKLPLPRIDPGVKIGVDRNGLYLCSANGSGDLKEALNCYVIPKADAMAPEGPALSRAQTFPKLIYAAVPAVDLDPNKAADAPAVLLNNEFGGPTCGKLYLYKITWSGQKARLWAAQEIALSKAYPVPRMEGLQPPPGIRLAQAGGRRNNCAFVQRGSVFGCNGAKRTPGSRPGILWYEVRIRDGALLQEGFVDDPNCDYLYPSMAVDSKGIIGIGCTRTSEKEFPSVCVMMHAAGDPAGTMRAPVLAVKGTTYYRYPGVTATNFSNYSTTCIDPSAPDLLWTYQGYANSLIDRQWCTAWAAFRMKAAEVHGREGPDRPHPHSEGPKRASSPGAFLSGAAAKGRCCCATPPLRLAGRGAPAVETATQGITQLLPGPGVTLDWPSVWTVVLSSWMPLPLSRSPPVWRAAMRAVKSLGSSHSCIIRSSAAAF